MNIFKLHRGYRGVGINFGLPVFYVDCGPGVGYDPVEVIKKLGHIGLGVGAWVVIRNNPLEEKGIGILVEGLKYVRVKVEVECSGSSRCPGWFPKVDRWMVDWVEGGIFNYGSLRNRQDMLIYKGSRVEDFIEKTEDLQALRVVIAEDIYKVWDLVKDHDIRVYGPEGG